MPEWASPRLWCWVILAVQATFQGAQNCFERSHIPIKCSAEPTEGRGAKMLPNKEIKPVQIQYFKIVFVILLHF